MVRPLPFTRPCCAFARSWIAECGRALQEPSRRLRLDLTGVTFIDASGVRALRSLPTDRVAIVHALDFIDALLKGDGTS